MNTGDSNDPLDELYLHADFLRRLARGLLGDEQRAEDLVQDTWVRALERPPLDAGTPRAWLATVARNLAFNARRGERRRRTREQEVAPRESQPSHESSVDHLELLGLVFDHVRQLREPYRGVIFQRYYEGLTPQAIAKRRGVSVETVKSQLARARATLRQELDERSGGRGVWTAGLVALFDPRAAPIAAGAFPLAGLGASLLVKKLVLAAFVLALFLFGWRALQSTTPAPPATIVQADSPALEQMGAQPLAAESAAVAEREAVPVAREPLASASSAALTGTLLVDLRWASDGTPAAGIRVDVVCEQDPAPREERFHGESDELGRIAFEELFAGGIELVTDRGIAWETEVAAGETRLVEFALPAGIDVVGVVVDPAGQPVAGAGIWVEGRPEVWPLAYPLARSGPDGGFRVRGLDDEACLGARAAGWRPSLMFEASGLPAGIAGARTITLALDSPCGPVHGRVLDPRGEPVAGAAVKIGPPGGGIVDLSSGTRGTWPGPVFVLTDARGEFLYPGDCAEGWQPAHVQVRGYPAWSGGVEVICGERARLEVRLPAPTSVAGRVLQADGSPVAGMLVRVRSDAAFPAPTATTDGEGRFMLAWVAPGFVQLAAQDWKRPRLGKAWASVTGVVGATASVDLVLDAGLTIGGRVVDGEGKPLVGWRVLADPVQFGSAPNALDTSDAEGRFLLANLAPGAWRVTTSAPGDPLLPPRAEQVLPQPGASDVELVVKNVGTQPARLRGRLQDVDGSVPVHADLTVHPKDGNRGLFIEFDPTTGAFEHATAVPGAYVLRVLHGGRTLGMAGPYTLQAGQTEDIGVLRLAELGKVELVLEGVPREELESVRATLDHADSGTMELTLEQGVHRASDLIEGTWILRLREGPWFLPEREVVVRAGSTTQVVAQPQRTFAFEITLAFAHPSAQWSDVRVEIRDPQGSIVRRSPNWWPAALQNGTISWNGLTLPAGRFQVEAVTDTGLRASGWIEVEKGKPAREPHTLLLQ